MLQPPKDFYQDTCISPAEEEDMTVKKQSSRVSVDKDKRRKSLIQETKIDENENALTFYHIVNMNQLKH